jgi:hypothetical protein
MKFLKIFSVLLIFSAICCKKLDIRKNEHSQSIFAVKFMYSNAYPIPINTESFFNFSEEHAKFNLPLDSDYFYNLVLEMPVTTNEQFGLLNYGFILENHKSSKRDTIYADSQLDTWIIKKNGMNIYYQDKEQILSDFLKEKYSFFNECW